MSNFKYNAFISYRHNKLDKSIAVKLQKMLEAYKPPASVDPDFKGFHIFRDETELPTSNDLSQDIRSALEGSEFLISLCSPSTKQSRWCLEEISYFKQLHNGSTANIITVLIDGDPSEVFPEELCTELVETLDANGNRVVEKRLVEPLAANLTSKTPSEKFRKLKAEFLRIAAPLLHCGYDNLYNRAQRQKNKRKLTVLSLIALSLAAFGVYTGSMLFKISSQKAELEKSYASLRLQNVEMLNKQAQDNLDAMNIPSAIENSLKALPQGGNDPILYNAAAENILSRSLNSYQLLDYITSTHTIELSDNISYVRYSSDGSRLFAADQSNNIYLIDTRERRIIKSYSAIETFGDINHTIELYVEGNVGYIACHNRLISVDMATGVTNWSYTSPRSDYIFSIQEIVSNPEASQIVLVYYTHYEVLEKDGSMISSEEMVLSGYRSRLYMDKDNTLYFYNAEKSVLSSIKSDEIHERSLGLTEKHIVMTICDTDGSLFFNTIISAQLGSAEHLRVICVDKSSLEIKWSRDYKTPEQITEYQLNELFPHSHNYPDGNGGYYARHGIVAVNANTVSAFDVESGEMYYQYHSGKDILFCKPNKGGSGLTFATEDQYSSNSHLITYSDNSFDIFSNGTSSFPMPITSCKAIDFSMDGDSLNFAYAKPLSSALTYTYKLKTPKNYFPFENVKAPYLYVENGDGLLGLYYVDYSQSEARYSVGIYDLKQNEFLDVHDIPYSVIKLLFTDDRLVLQCSGGNVLMLELSGRLSESFNVNQLLKDHYESNNIVEQYDSSVHSVFAYDNSLYCISNHCIFKYDIASQGVEEIYYTKDMMIYGDGIAINDGRLVFVIKSPSNSISMAEYIDLDTNELHHISENEKPISYQLISSIACSDNGDLIAYISMDNIEIYRHESKTIAKIPYSSMTATPKRLIFTPDSEHLIVQCADGEFRKYSVNDTALVGRCKADHQIYGEPQFVDNNCFAIDGNPAVIIDTREMKISAQVNHYAGVLKSEGAILFNSTMYTLPFDFGYYKHLSAQELDASAKSLLEELAE